MARPKPADAPVMIHVRRVPGRDVMPATLGVRARSNANAASAAARRRSACRAVRHPLFPNPRTGFAPHGPIPGRPSASSGACPRRTRRSTHRTWRAPSPMTSPRRDAANRRRRTGRAAADFLERQGRAVLDDRPEGSRPDPRSSRFRTRGEQRPRESGSTFRADENSVQALPSQMSEVAGLCSA